MKIIVFSDSHGDISLMKRAIKAVGPDRVIHLGDYTRDALEIGKLFPELHLDVVKGNNDFTSSYPQDKVLDVAKKTLFLSHGDRYGVMLGLHRIAWKGRELGVDAVLFGHTHIPYLERVGGMWVMNPGCIGRSTFFSRSATYGLIEVSEDEITCEIRNIK